MKLLSQITLKEQREILAMFVSSYMDYPEIKNREYLECMFTYRVYKVVFDLFDEE